MKILGINETSHDAAVSLIENGKILFDSSRPDGMPKKLMDSSLLRGLGWNPTIDLIQGLEFAYDDLKSRPSKSLES